MSNENRSETLNWKWPALFFGAAVIVVCAFGFPALEHLLLGWLYFPLQNLSRATIDPPAVLLGIVCLAAFIVGLHFILSRFSRQSNATVAAPWSWRSTIAISLMLLLMFVAGTAMVGAAHQLAWLASGRSRDSANKREPVLAVTEAVRSASHQARESNELRFIALGIQNFHDTYQALPPGGTMNQEGEQLHGWAMYAGSFMTFVADGIDFSIPWNRPPNDRFYKCNMQMFVNPAIGEPYFDKQGFGLAHVAGNVHVLPIRTINQSDFRPGEKDGPPLRQLHQTNQSMGPAQITDGTANTILVGTVAKNFRPWGHPANVRDPAHGINRSPDGFGGPERWNGAVFAFCDGHTALLSNKIDPRVLKQLATPAGGENPQY